MGLSWTHKESKATQAFHEEVKFVPREATTFRGVTTLLVHLMFSIKKSLPALRIILTSGRIQAKGKVKP